MHITTETLSFTTLGVAMTTCHHPSTTYVYIQDRRKERDHIVPHTRTHPNALTPQIYNSLAIFMARGTSDKVNSSNRSASVFTIISKYSWNKE